MRQGILYINDQPLPRELISHDRTGQLFRETSPNGRSYLIREMGSNNRLDHTITYVVPDRHYFVMGDNRDNSLDSRADVGMVPEENIVGRAEVVYFSIGRSPLVGIGGRGWVIFELNDS